MKQRFYFSILLLLPLIGFSQNLNKINPSDWKIISENDQVTFYSKAFNCEIPQEGLYAEYVLIKIENKTNQTITVSWFNDTYMDNGCVNCDHSLRDRKRTLTLKPHAIEEGNCNPGLNVGLKVFSKWLRMENEQILTRLAITDVQTIISK